MLRVRSTLDTPSRSTDQEAIISRTTSCAKCQHSFALARFSFAIFDAGCEEQEHLAPGVGPSFGIGSWIATLRLQKAAEFFQFEADIACRSWPIGDENEVAGTLILEMLEGIRKRNRLQSTHGNVGER